MCLGCVCPKVAFVGLDLGRSSGSGAPHLGAEGVGRRQLLHTTGNLLRLHPGPPVASAMGRAEPEESSHHLIISLFGLY